MVPSEIPSYVDEIFRENYNILGRISFLDFDYDFNILFDFLSDLKKESYGPNDRIIIEHFDTDIYIPECSVGINLRNFFTVLHSVDIPEFVILLYTNHIGIRTEVQQLSKEKVSGPTVIETMLSNLHYDNTALIDNQLDITSIKYNALCMMHLSRSHRHALANSVCDIDSSKLVLKLTSNINIRDLS
tara:strand:- start:225 stop:785 length:561 start_codon:yes stop_codon:yes gene_type:complete